MAKAHTWLINLALATTTVCLSPLRVLAQEALDLTSSSRSVAVDQAMLGGNSLTIRTGNTLKTIQVGDAISAAELVAVRSVLNGGRQTLQLNNNGTAASGSFHLGENTSQLSTLVVPAHVTAVAPGASLDVVNNLVANGVLQTLGGGTGTFQLSAGNIAIGALGAITSPVNLFIQSRGDMINAGLIEANSLSIQAASGNIVNSGIINATQGNLVLDTVSTPPLRIDNRQGLMSAALGSIIARNPAYTGKEATFMIGGTWQAQRLEVFGGHGVARLSAEELNGALHIHAGDAHIFTERGTINIAAMDLPGDPTIVNNGGDILLTGNADAGATLRFSGEHLAIIAAGRITADPALTLIDLSSSTRAGGNLTILAGFTVTPTPGVGTIFDTTTNYTLSAPSGLPADIELGSVNINTSSTAGAGGQVLIAANDTIAGDGLASIRLNGIDTSSTIAAGGAITIIGKSDPIGILGDVKTTGTTSGDLSIYSGTPAPDGTVRFTNGLMTGSMSYFEDTVNIADVVLFGQTDLRGTSGADGTFGVATPGQFIMNTGAGIKAGDLLIATGSHTTLLGNNWLEASIDMGIFTVDPGASIVILPGSTLKANVDMVLFAAEGDIADFSGSTFETTTGSIVFAAQNSIGIGDNSTYTAGDSIIFLTDQSDMSAGNNNSFVAGGSLGFLSGGQLSIGTGNTLSAGRLDPAAPANGVLLPAHIASPGDMIFLSYGDLSLNSSATVRGGDFMAAALGAGHNLSLAPATSFNAHGGYITMFAGGTLTGNGNNFYSRAAGTPTNFRGGLIQISSGFSFNPDLISLGSTATGNESELNDARAQILSAAASLQAYANGDPVGFKSPPLDPAGIISDPTVMGANVSVNDNGLEPGLVLPHKLSGGLIDISNSTISIARGAAIFDSVGGGASIQLPNSSFTVESYDLLPTGLFDNVLEDVTGFLDSIEAKLNGLNLNHLNTDENGVTILPTDENRIGITRLLSAISKPDDDKEGNADEAVKNKQLFGKVSTLAARALEKRFNNHAVVDTGKTEPRIGATAQQVAQTMRVVNRQDLAPNTVNTLNTAINALTFKVDNLSPPVVRISEQRPDVMLFTTSNQVMSGELAGGADTVLIGSEGTTVSATADGVVLHTGGLIADSGEKPVNVVSKSGKISLNKGSTAAIISAPDAGVRIIALAGSERAVSFTPHGSEKQEAVNLQPGDELVIPDAQTVASEAQSRALNIMIKSPTRASQFVASELAGTLPRPSIRLSGARNNYMRMVSRLESTMQQGTDGSNSASGRLFSQLTLGADSAAPTRVVASDGTLIQEEGKGIFRLAHGSMLSTSQQPVKIKTDLATIQAEGRSVVSVDAAPGRVRVRACSGPGHVAVKTDKHTIELNPGEEIMLADERPTKGEALGNDGIGRRQLSLEKLSPGMWAVTGDFSIASMLNGAGYVKPIRSNPNQSSTILISGLLKTHAALEYATGARGRYFAQPKETATIPDWIFKCHLDF